MVIKVTKEHIKSGCRHNPSTCPVALAIIDAMGHSADNYSISVGTGRATLWDLTEYNDRYFELPLIARKFIENFDAGGLRKWLFARPFEFEIPL